MDNNAISFERRDHFLKKKEIRAETMHMNPLIRITER